MRFPWPLPLAASLGRFPWPLPVAAPAGPFLLRPLGLVPLVRPLGRYPEPDPPRSSTPERRGPRPADLVFGPTSACRDDRRPSDDFAPSPAEVSPVGQDLHLNRAMLTDQGSAYVGRFARGWHRLPGIRSPGQPQTRTRARGRV
jgi:hypothetical protein